MLAKESTEPFSDKDWLFEIKWDGYRAIAEVENGRVLLYSRNGLDFREAYPIVADQLKNIKGKNVVVDGEIIVLDDGGEPNFQYLQHYSENQERPIQFQIFDLLQLNGKDTTGLTLVERKELLKEVIPENAVIKYSDHIQEKGEAFFELTRKRNLEGIMAKKMDSLYYPGKRTANWLKIKHHRTREAIIAGYTKPAGARKYFGALILGAYEGNDLIYIGHTGTGFSNASLKELYDVMEKLEQTTSPFSEKIKANAPVVWLKPELICEIKFSEITRDGKLRHPVFLHLRNDKKLKEITMNTSDKKKLKPATGEVKSKNKNIYKKKITSTKKAESTKVSDSENSGERIFTFGKNKVSVSNYDKVYFPKEGITKGDIVDYYIRISKYILPYLKGRPESLLRNPNGINKPGFFHKDAGENVPSFIKTTIVHSESNDKEIDYIVCNNQATLTYLNNLGCIEINPWHSSLPKLDYPDYLMIDIDPSEKNTFDQVIEVALEVKKVLDKAGAPCFVKTSGASGIHVYVPTGKKYDFEQVKDFAYLVVMLVHEALPDFTTLERNLKKRGNKHIYLDYLQNRRGQTIASVYSARPKPGATVSTPLLWEEVKKGLTPQQFTIFNIEERIKKMGDIFKGILGKGIDMKKCIKNLSK